MSCCGKRRQSATSIKEAIPIVNNNTNSSSPSVMFRYIGNWSLRVRGTASKKLYYFSTKTPTLPVTIEDAQALRNYPELQEVSSY